MANQVEQGIKLSVPELCKQSWMHAVRVCLAQVLKAERGVGQDDPGVVSDVGIQSTRSEVSGGLQQLLLIDGCHTDDDNDRVERLHPVASYCRHRSCQADRSARVARVARGEYAVPD